MRIRLYIDEDSMNRALVRALNARGIDVLTALEANMIKQPDEAHLVHASSQERVLYSFNVGDFCRLHKSFMEEGRHHAGIILARQQTLSVGQQLRRLLRLISLVTAEEMRDQVDLLSRWPAA